MHHNKQIDMTIKHMKHVCKYKEINIPKTHQILFSFLQNKIICINKKFFSHQTTCDFKGMSFMDGFSVYNQIKMYPDDEKHTSFRTSLGVFVIRLLLAQRPITLVLMMINSCSYSTNDLVFI